MGLVKAPSAAITSFQHGRYNAKTTGTVRLGVVRKECVGGALNKHTTPQRDILVRRNVNGANAFRRGWESGVGVGQERKQQQLQESKSQRHMGEDMVSELVANWCLAVMEAMKGGSDDRQSQRRGLKGRGGHKRVI